MRAGLSGSLTILLIAGAGLVGPPPAAAASSWTVAGPAGSPVTARLGLDGAGRLSFGVDLRGASVRAGAAAVPVTADVTGVRLLTLRVTDGGDGKNSDHADWANAVLTCR